ncbi:hypothetical protein BY996DRAFT_6415431 [Phakopsora pachyrhizi]|uniref:CSEP-23 n=1 Tax=Phakopsora pachyrhizi TaxID=170000 RepID=A0A0S1MIR3_PHAPC
MEQKKSFKALVVLLFALLNLLVSISSAPMSKITTETSKILNPETNLSLIEKSTENNRVEGLTDLKSVENNPASKTQSAPSYQPLSVVDSSKSQGSTAPILYNYQTPTTQTFTYQNPEIPLYGKIKYGTTSRTYK